MEVRNPMFIFYVEDMSRAMQFYRDTFELKPVMTTPGWCMLRCAECTVALHIADEPMAKLRSRVSGLSFEVVEDLESVADKVRAAGGSAGPIRPAGMGAPVRVCEVRDPDGNALDLRQFVGQQDHNLTAGR